MVFAGEELAPMAVSAEIQNNDGIHIIKNLLCQIQRHIGIRLLGQRLHALHIHLRDTFWQKQTTIWSQPHKGSIGERE